MVPLSSMAMPAIHAAPIVKIAVVMFPAAAGETCRVGRIWASSVVAIEPKAICALRLCATQAKRDTRGDGVGVAVGALRRERTVNAF